MFIAIFHCTIKIIKRSMGKSAVAAATYQSGERLVNEWNGLTHDYTRKGGEVSFSNSANRRFKVSPF